MKIIERGQEPKDKIGQWRCDNCNTLIESTINEGKIVYDQRNGNYVKCNCPQCKEINCIDTSKFNQKKIKMNKQKNTFLKFFLMFLPGGLLASGWWSWAIFASPYLNKENWATVYLVLLYLISFILCLIAGNLILNDIDN